LPRQKFLNKINHSFLYQKNFTSWIKKNKKRFDN